MSRHERVGAGTDAAGWAPAPAVPAALTTPRMAGLVGVAFAFLFGAVLVLMHGSLTTEMGADVLTAGGSRTRLGVATMLMPFAGIAFLWFIAVVRDGMGRAEDRFYSTVFLGSGLVFLAIMFVAMALAAGLIVASQHGESPLPVGVTHFGAGVAVAASKTYALRMGAVFMISLATIWRKTDLMPHWLVLVTYVSALALLAISDLSAWITLAFPVWVLVVSVVILLRPGRTGAPAVVRADG